MTDYIEKLVAHGPSTMLADQRPDTQAELVRRLAARLEATPYGAELPALADGNQDALERSECERG
jgi:hypothetical protein